MTTGGRASRTVFVVLWAILIAAGAYLYFFRRDAAQAGLREAFSAPVAIAATLYLLCNAVRPFTLIPPTFILFAAMPFIEPILLFPLTLAAIALSSSIFYWFSEVLHFDEMFERTQKARIEQLRGLLQRYELPIIIGWSFFLILPTDLLCYVCGTLRINFPKFLIGVVIGEGTIFGLYIFFGSYLLDRLPFGL